MKYTSRPDIPAPILKALMSDEYEDSLQEHFDSLPDKIKATFTHAISVTTLPRSSRQRVLFKRHQHEMEQDPMKKFWAMGGRSIHSILEENHNPLTDVVEERLGMVFPVMLGEKTKLDVYLHGAADLHDTSEGRLDDYKWTSAGSLLYPKDEHIAQLNTLGYIWGQNKRRITRLRNVYLLRDWDPHMVREGGEYPKEPLVVKEVPMWPINQVMDYLKRRLVSHFTNEHRKDEQLDFCTDAERWQSEAKFGVYKEGAEKMAKHWATSRMEAEDKIAELEAEEWQKLLDYREGLKKKKPTDDDLKAKMPKFFYREVPAEPRRCALCECAPYCNQRINELMAQQSAEAA